MKIQKIYDKGSAKLNEDELLIKDNLFAVFDGATSLYNHTNKIGETGAKIAARIAKKIFSKNYKTLKDLAKEANEKILIEMKKAGIDTKKKECCWSTAFAAVRIGKDIEFCNISDSLVLFVFNDNSYRLAAKYIDHDLGNMIKWKKLAEEGKENIYEFLKPDRIALRKQANIKFGVLNGENSFEKFLNYGKIKTKGIKTIILFTDGLMLPKKTPENPEDWNLFVEIYKKSGLKGLLKHVRSLENSDPKCWKYIRYKKHDDVAAIAIDF